MEDGMDRKIFAGGNNAGNSNQMHTSSNQMNDLLDTVVLKCLNSRCVERIESIETMGAHNLMEELHTDSIGWGQRGHR